MPLLLILKTPLPHKKQPDAILAPSQKNNPTRSLRVGVVLTAKHSELNYCDLQVTLCRALGHAQRSVQPFGARKNTRRKQQKYLDPSSASCAKQGKPHGHSNSVPRLVPAIHGGRRRSRVSECERIVQNQLPQHTRGSGIQKDACRIFLRASARALSSDLQDT